MDKILNEKTWDEESYDDQKERWSYDMRIFDALDRMINRDPDFWDKIDRFKNRSNWRPNWLK